LDETKRDCCETMRNKDGKRSERRLIRSSFERPALIFPLKRRFLSVLRPDFIRPTVQKRHRSYAEHSSTLAKQLCSIPGQSRRDFPESIASGSTQVGYPPQEMIWHPTSLSSSRRASAGITIIIRSIGPNRAGTSYLSEN
jgi:hypothetical protein